MSIEDKLAALVTAIEANTDALQQCASAMRANAAQPPKTAATAAPTPAPKPPTEGAGNETPRRGRPPKTTPPPSPADLASQDSAAPSTTKASATPASAPAAAAGSAEPEEREPDYADLSAVVGQVASKHGRSKALAIFTEMGFTSGVELNSKAPERIPEAVKRFREAL